jgi:gliding motility-associated-like protein
LAPGRIVQQHRRIDSLINLRQRDRIVPGKIAVIKANEFTNLNNYPVNHRQANEVRNSSRILSSPVERIAGTACKDTSLRLVYHKMPDLTYPDYITKTRDGNILIAGLDYHYSKNQTTGHLLKVTQKGDTLWTRSIIGGYPGNWHYLVVYKAFELNDNSLLVVGEMAVPMPYNGRYDPVIMRLTATGNLIWQKTFKTKVWDVDTTMGSVQVIDCQQDAKGDIYLAGAIHNDALPRAGLIAKMDPDGKVLWSKAIYTHSTPQMTGINVTDNSVTFLGRTITSDNILNFGIVADAATGDTLSTTCFQSATNDFWHSFYGNNMVKLNNGNLMVYGRGVSDGVSFDPTKLPVHCGLMELTPDLHFVQSYILKSPTASNSYNTVFTVFPDGSASYTWLKYYSGYSADVIYGNIKNGQILKERVIPYRGIATAWSSNFLQMDDAGQILVNLIGDSIANSNYIELMKLHNSDTAGSCLGKDTLSTIIEKQYYYNTNIYIDSILTNVLTEEQRPFDGVYNNDFVIQSGCKQVSFCDSLKLSTPKDTVCANSPVLIHIAKNKECGAIPLWNYDTTAVSDFFKVNDSTVSATFNKTWKGAITASVTGCSTIADSLHFTVLQAAALLDIGPDTLICPGNTILLNAKAGFVSYQWQDGSTDSAYTVTVPGSYYVTTTDACSNRFADTVIVASHPPIPFDLGPDISICKNDTVNIVAPAGFKHYQWTPDHITDDTLQTAQVFPLVNTWYKVIAEQTQGCFASDSVYVTVNAVPAVHLGNDTSFCANESLTLDAGSGYDTYLWSNGVTGEKIVVNQKGSYSIKATLNGCTASDTLHVLNVYPLPSFSLGNDTALCQYQQLQYNFNLPDANYEWNTGNSSNAETIHLPGIYWLRVMQNGCAASDTLQVAYKPSPVVNLGNDTTLCEGQTLLLSAYNDDANYLWQDGSTAATKLVKEAGTYLITANINQCVASDTITVKYKAQPYFSLGRDTFVCEGESYVLSPVVTTNASLVWQDGSTQQSFTVSKEGLYFLVATNECGSYKDSIMITTSFCNIIMPTGFTPNGDGLNDVFKVKYPFPVKEFHLMVFDRWGNKVFETNKIDAGWDGTYKGEPSVKSSYVWVISFMDVNNKPWQLKGIVTLLR